jgi:ATP-dependent RNA helicase DeaD
MNDNFKEFNLSERMKENLSNLNYTKLTTIQEKVIPIALNGKDLIGQSRTGTGKTAAFLIPIIETVESGKGQQALILAPTRELAIQIKEESLKFSKGMEINTLAIYGQESIENQIFQLKKKAEIVVGTPGRVLDHLKRRTLKLENLKFFVLDEVDEMLKKGFIDDIKTIAKEAKSEKLQTLFFSATVSRETRDLSDSFLKNPVIINNMQKDDTIKPLISQYYLLVNDIRSKLSSLINIIHFQNPDLAIIFAGTKRMVDLISDELTLEGFQVEKIHSDLTQKKRIEVYNNFKNKKIRFLVATDIAARGIDIEGITHVYNFDYPQDPEYYTHRIGRTGRAGLTGQSIILLSNWEVRRQIPFLERLTGEKIEQIYNPEQKEIDEIIETRSLEKIVDKIKIAKDKELSSKSIEILKSYTREEIMKGMINIFQLKKRRVVVHQQNFEQQSNDRRNFRRPSSSSFSRFNRGYNNTDANKRDFKSNSNRSSYEKRSQNRYGR